MGSIRQDKWWIKDAIGIRDMTLEADKGSTKNGSQTNTRRRDAMVPAPAVDDEKGYPIDCSIIEDKK